MLLIILLAISQIISPWITVRAEENNIKLERDYIDIKVSKMKEISKVVIQGDIKKMMNQMIK